MFTTPEQVASANKANLESLLTVANTAFAGAERLAALNLNIARTALEESLANARAVMAAKDVQEVLNIQAALAQPAFDKAVAYSHDVYEITSQTQEELRRLFEAQFADANKAMTVALDKAARSAPAGSDVAVATVKSALAAANTAYESMSKAARQVAEMAEANVAAATNATVKAAGSAAKGRKAA